MSKKTISIVVLSTIIATCGLQPIKASAIECTPTIKEQTKIPNSMKIEDGKVYNLNKAIKIIENKYLKQNADGTLKIKATASNEIGKDSLNLIYKQVNFVNEKIRNDELKFKFINTSNGVKVKTIKQNVIDESSRNIGSNIFNNRLCTFDWHWWGFYANVNKIGTQKLENEYIQMAKKYGVIYGILAFVPGGKIPVAVSAAITELTIGDAILICKNGKIDNGVSVGALGDPSSPGIFHLCEN